MDLNKQMTNSEHKTFSTSPSVKCCLQTAKASFGPFQFEGSPAFSHNQRLYLFIEDAIKGPLGFLLFSLETLLIISTAY